MPPATRSPMSVAAFFDDRPWRSAVLFACIYYGFLLIGGARFFELPRPPMDLTFNSMLDHLLHGRFDVDPVVIGDEGFIRNGRAYAYWGIFPALLRLPLMGASNWQTINITLPSCLLATLLAVAAKLWALRAVAVTRTDLPVWLVRVLMLVLVLSGAQIGFLRPSIYQEVCSWGAAFGALFVAAAVAGWIDGFDRGRLLAMALACAGALLTRVSVAVGLAAAFGLLFLVEAARERDRPLALLRRYALPVAVLALAGALTGYVNFERWGNPLTFVDYSYHKMNAFFPDRVARTAQYGLFNLERIPFGLVYYFLPVWVLPGGDGALLLSGVRDRLIDSAELPPMSFLLTDPLLLVPGGLALAGWWRRRDGQAAAGGAIALGLAAPAVLMLAAISMCFRYRMDFYPLFEFLAFAGLCLGGGGWLARRRRLVGVLAAVGILASHLSLLLYDLGEFGPGQTALRGRGVVQYYVDRAARPAP